MSVAVEVETVVARPRGDVAAYVFDWRNDPIWIGGISEAHLITNGSFGVGSRVSRAATFLGRRIEYVNEIVEYEPERRLVMRSVQGPFPMTVAYDLAEAEGGTRFRIHVKGDASRFYRLAGPVLSRAVKRSIAGDLHRLKRLLEWSAPAGAST